MEKILKTFVFFLTIILCIQTTYIYGNDFEITSEYNIYLENKNDEKVKIEEILIIQTHNSEFYIPAHSEQIITIPSLSTKNVEENKKLKKQTLEVEDRNGQFLNYELEEDGNLLIVKVKNPQDISRGNQFYAKISYETKELVNHSGNITNIYLPGLHENTKFEEIGKHNLTTRYIYNLTYHVPLDTQEASYMSPQNITTFKDDKYVKYMFPQTERIDNTGWIQLGNEQYYYFKIVQRLPKTDSFTPTKFNQFTDLISTNILEIVLPKEFEEVNQKVFVKNISTNLKRIRLDNEENVIAIFEPRANEEEIVEIEGYISMRTNIQELPNMSLEGYFEKIKGLNRLNIFIQDDKFWESNSAEIKLISRKMKNENDNILDLITSNYNFVIEKLEYSEAKATGENTRMGALKTLKGGPAVCMEYADLLIAIFRAQGIPAKAAFGYGNDPNKPEKMNNLAQDAGHQWVQIWLPSYGWLSIDPTWGETNREYIGGDLDHILWYTIADSAETISETMLYSADSVNSSIFDDYEIVVKPVNKDSLPDLNTLEKLEHLVFEYDRDEEESEIEHILKTTTVGRSLIYIIPIAVLVITMLIITITIAKLIRKS